MALGICWDDSLGMLCLPDDIRILLTPGYFRVFEADQSRGLLISYKASTFYMITCFAALSLLTDFFLCSS